MTCHRTSTTLRIADPAALTAHFREEFETHDLPTSTAADGTLSCDTGIGLLHVRPDRNAICIRIEAPSRNELFMLRESVSARLDVFAPGLGDGLSWRGAMFGSARPPNFRIGRVAARERISARFLRLRLEADDLSDFARSGLHFRLLLPADARAPVWPELSPDGRTIWPRGQDRLHAPPYTIRRVDPVAGWLDVDIFLHGNGPTCAWAKRVACGAEVGMTGPGGGWFPEATDIVLAGDETALPAIARILEAAGRDTTGTALIEVADDDDILPLTHPGGVSVTWLRRTKGDPPLMDALTDTVSAPGPFVWCASEKAEALRARQYLRHDLNLPRHDSQVARYWSRSS